MCTILCAIFFPRTIALKQFRRNILTVERTATTLCSQLDIVCNLVFAFMMHIYVSFCDGELCTHERCACERKQAWERADIALGLTSSKRVIVPRQN